MRSVKWGPDEVLVITLPVEGYKETVEVVMTRMPSLQVASAVSHHALRRIGRFVGEHAVYLTVRT